MINHRFRYIRLAALSLFTSSSVYGTPNVDTLVSHLEDYHASLYRVNKIILEARQEALNLDRDAGIPASVNEAFRIGLSPLGEGNDERIKEAIMDEGNTSFGSILAREVIEHALAIAQIETTSEKFGYYRAMFAEVIATAVYGAASDASVLAERQDVIKAPALFSLLAQDLQTQGELDLLPTYIAGKQRILRSPIGAIQFMTHEQVGHYLQSHDHDLTGAITQRDFYGLS